MERSPAEARLSRWLKLWAPAFAAGGAAFYLLPGAVTASLARTGRMVGLEEARGPHGGGSDADNLWVVLAGAYMALITAISAQAAERPLAREDLVRLLILGKTASSLGALGYFLFRRRAFAFLANFLLDGAIAGVTYALLEDARPG
ncbi:MAG TPA: hypothetical protein VG245_01040 [Candidatus Dormibacteraeota bacterium]|jgi:hypothetical protein|nr:hypothetical protein [Candidatus Dormibacteraeota bacterium]